MEPGQHVELSVGALPQSPIDAHARFFSHELAAIRAAITGQEAASLTIILPPATSDHDGWRRAVAGDLARAYAPRRVNIAAGPQGTALAKVLEYLRDAPGVTGHYVQAHD